jgi:single-strand DNA-binding protein
VYIEGRIKSRKWTDDKGMERYSTEIHCTDFTFLSNKNDGQDTTPQQNQEQTSQQTALTKDTPAPSNDLPF